MEEKQGPPKFARHAGIQYDDDDAYYDHKDDSNGDDPNTAVAFQTLFRSKRLI